MFEQEAMNQYGPIVDLYQNFETVQRDKENSSAISQPLMDEELKRYIIKRKQDRLDVVKNMTTQVITIVEPTNSSHQQKRKLDFTEEELVTKRKKFDALATKFQKIFDQPSLQGLFSITIFIATTHNCFCRCRSFQMYHHVRKYCVAEQSNATKSVQEGIFR